MSYELSNEEKTSIIEQHLKNLEYSKFNLEMSLVQELAVTNPQQTVINSLNAQIDEIITKNTKLLEELAKIN
jgi:cell fate regulator YaaT (PSP1 superfamily)